MRTETQPIVVGINGAPETDAALRWAVTEARASNAALRLIYAYLWELPYGDIPLYHNFSPAEIRLGHRQAKQVVARMVHRVHEIDATVEAEGVAIDGEPVSVLLSESERARLLVLGSRHLKAIGSAVLGSVSAAVAARSHCPAVVVRGPAGSPFENAGVVVGVDGTESSAAVLEFGFDEASRHQVPLRPVLCWAPDLLAAMSWRFEPPAPERAHAWLAEALAGWREKYPDVDVRSEVLREHPVAGLVLASAAQYLLVVGSHGHHALPGTLLGSVSQGVLHHATCPTAVVPTHRV